MPRPRYPRVTKEFGKKPSKGPRPIMWYFRVNHGPRTRLEGAYGSPDFVLHHRKLLADSGKTEPYLIKPIAPAAPFHARTRSRWEELRYRALKLHGTRCQCCGATPGDGRALHVDHIKPRSRFPELEWTLSNLQILCEDCNLGKGAWDQTDWRREASR
jgi:HNH endonuclease